jgi:hypothetical protein
LQRSGTDFRLQVAGEGPQASELRARLQAHDSAGRIEWLGALAPAQLARQVYDHADVLLLPSVWETGPIVAWEAMAHGAALVSSRYIGSGLEGALHDEENCLMFDVGDAAGAARQLARVADADLRAHIAANGRALVQQRYTQELSVRDWASALGRIVAMPPRERGDVPKVASAGRLDAWLGTSWAESMRRVARRRFEHGSPGGEWPHSYGARGFDDPSFWRIARDTDGAQA